MFTKSIFTAAAFALVAGLGSASAGEKFTTLNGVTGEAMSTAEMGATVGANDPGFFYYSDDTNPGGGTRTGDAFRTWNAHGHLGALENSRRTVVTCATGTGWPICG